MPKLAIYVPKKEMRELEKWRKQINFSKVFMRAVMREIRQRARSVREDDRVASAAEHYKQRLAVDSGPLEELGFDLGTAHVLDCRLSPEQIRQVVELGEFDPARPEHASLVEKTIGDEMTKVDGALEGGTDASRQAWRLVVYGGYVKGVVTAWQRVCEQM